MKRNTLVTSHMGVQNEITKLELRVRLVKVRSSFGFRQWELGSSFNLETDTP